MTEKKDYRWQQRFQTFENSYSQLEKALSIKELDYLQRAGVIQLFQLAFELAWKVLKDYLEHDDGQLEIGGPRKVIQTAIQSGLINENDGYDWIEALDSRNALTHTYSEQLAIENEMKIRNKFYPMLQKFYLQWKQKQ